MNYQQALDYLYSQLPMFQRIGQAAYKADLSNTIALCKALGNPEKGFKSIHVAGTNGKGSVSHFLAAIFQAAGYKTGLFTSPHYLDFRERIKVNGQMIDEQEVANFVSFNILMFEKIKPSFFEMSAGLAFKYFESEKVDIAIIETGMGGRLDSTNVVIPELSIITNIGKDHIQFLGDTLEKIAGEKAGIIKQGIPVVIGESQEETDKVFTQKAKSLGCDIRFANRHYDITKTSEETDTMRLVVSAMDNSGGMLDNLVLGLVGDYQLKNIATVLQSVEVLRGIGYELGEAEVRVGLEKVVESTGMQGRWQVLGRNPLTICDAAHNSHGLKYVMDQLKHTPHQKLHMVFGTVNDKDVTDILDLLPTEATYYLCKATVPRALGEEELKIMAEAKDLESLAYPDVKSAWIAAKKNASENDLIFIGGSTFVVADALVALKEGAI